VILNGKNEKDDASSPAEESEDCANDSDWSEEASPEEVAPDGTFLILKKT